MITISFGRKDKTVQTVAAEAPKVKRPRGAWKSDPISPKQIGTIASLFRSKGLVEDETVTFGGMTFRYDANLPRPDGKVGGWVGLAGLTKGQASDLMDALFNLPKPGFSPVTEGQAAPIPATAPKAAPLTKGDTVEIDGVVYRIAGKAK